MHNIQTEKQPLIAIVGPTATGKTDLSLDLAEAHSGEIVSADSRQIYRGLDIGSGKVNPQERARVPHYLLDVAEPGETYTLAQYQRDATRAIEDILSRDNIPFLVGGTPLYLYAVIDNYRIPSVPPLPALRALLEKASTETLFALLAHKDPETARNIDRNNPRRLIRALEVVYATRRSFSLQKKKGRRRWRTLKLAIDMPRSVLYERIDKRVDVRKDKMEQEISNLLACGVSPHWLSRLGLEYRFVTAYLTGEMPREEAIKKLKYAIHRFARRQLTWFRKDKEIIWASSPSEAELHVRQFLTLTA